MISIIQIPMISIIQISTQFKCDRFTILLICYNFPLRHDKIQLFFFLIFPGFSNLPQWVARLDEEVEKKLAQRLSAAVRVWVDVLTERQRRQDDDDSVIRRRGARQEDAAAFAPLFDPFCSDG